MFEKQQLEAVAGEKRAAFEAEVNGGGQVWNDY